VNVPSILEAADNHVRNGRYLTRIAANGKVFQLMECRFGCFNEAIYRSFSDAIQLGVGTNLYKEPVFPFCANRVSFDVCNFHYPLSMKIRPNQSVQEHSPASSVSRWHEAEPSPNPLYPDSG